MGRGGSSGPPRLPFRKGTTVFDIEARTTYTLKFDRPNRDVLLAALIEYMANHKEEADQMAAAPGQFKPDDDTNILNRHNVARRLAGALDDVDEHHHIRA